MKPKKSVSTALEEDLVARIDRLAIEDVTTSAAIIRKCVMRHLPELERDILGEEFVGTAEVAIPKRRKLAAA